MEISESEIIEYIEPVYRFCANRLHNRQDAEDLAGEIMVHILSGVRKYRIDSLRAWVWRIAHNRYARFIDKQSHALEQPSDDDFADIQDDYDFVDEVMIEDEYQPVFRYLHTLSSEYRNILADYYIGQLTVKQLTGIYGLTETTVKWRLNAGREKIKTRIGEHQMDRIYKPINWNTGVCSGACDPDKYLHGQVARAICEAAYEKPLTVEEISLATGLPTLYVEDELPRMLDGEAIAKVGNKYATNFIVLRLRDKKAMMTQFAPLVAGIADHFARAFAEGGADVAKMCFYGAERGMRRLGYIALSSVMRCKMCHIIDGLNLDEGPFPPRHDGGYGWFLVDERQEGEEVLDDTAIGSNNWWDGQTEILYLWIGKYFDGDVYNNHGTRWIVEHKLVEKAVSGVIPDDALTDDDRVGLLRNNLIFKDGDKYKLNFPVFANRAQWDAFFGRFYTLGDEFDAELLRIISDINRSFRAFVPKRLDSQINIWVKNYSYNIIGFVAEELISRGVLEKPDGERPLTDGVLCVRNGGDLKI